MVIMDYVTPGITKIDYEDNLFVLTDVGRDNTKDVQALIESRGGIVKCSVTKAPNYLIYGDGEEDTTKYKKALELINDKWTWNQCAFAEHVLYSQSWRRPDRVWLVSV